MRREPVNPRQWQPRIAGLAVLGMIVLSVAEPARAAEHLVSGCLELADSRNVAPPGRGGNNPIDEVEVEILFTDVFGNEHQAAPTPGSPVLRTDENGCFAARLTLVPEVTTVRPRFVLEESHRKVKNASAVWRMILPPEFDAELTAGEAAVFGTPGSPLHAIDHDDNAALQMWINAEDAVTLYEEGIGPWSTASLTRPRVVVRYPSARSNSDAAVTRIAITADHRKKWNVFLHEFGHYFSLNDASTLAPLSGLCPDKTSTVWPFSQPPYSYEDPGAPSECNHSDWSFEAADRALSEGFADFTRYFLIDDATTMDESGSPGARYCSRWKNRRLEDNTDNQHFYNSVNWDGERNETNVAQALCDLVDDDFESVTYLHQWGDSGHVTPIELGDFAPNLASTLGMNPTHTFAAQGTEIFQIEFATGNVSLLFDAATASDVEKVTADANQVCATDGNAVHCFSLATGGPVTALLLPSLIRDNGIRDIQLSGGELFVMATYLSFFPEIPLRVHHYDTSVPSWNLVYEEDVISLPGDEQPQRFAIGGVSPTAKLFMARGSWVEQCAVSNCAATLTHYVGDPAGGAGYRRGDASTALLQTIRQLVRVPGQARLAIVDQYGVSTIDDGDAQLEQWIGRGVDRVFENNLSRRGLVLGGAYNGILNLDVHPLYASNGLMEVVLDSEGTDFALDRSAIREDSDENPLIRGYLIDSSVPTTDRYYCAEENVVMDPEDVFTMFAGNPYRTSIVNALSSYVGVTPAEQNAVTETSWVNLPPPGNCETENIRREQIDTAPSGAGQPIAEIDECGGYVGPDADDLIEYGFFEQNLVIGQQEGEGQPHKFDLEGLPVLLGSDCTGGGSDLDGDGVCDAFDTCLLTPNPAQIDTDLDGCGNQCDGDFTQDGIVGGPDFSVFVSAFFARSAGSPGFNPHVDANGDGLVGGPDFGSFARQLASGTPGPSLRDDRDVLSCP